MMKFKAFVLIIFFICFSEISISHENKIAYLDLNFIMGNSIAGKSITSQLEKNHKKILKILKKLKKNLKMKNQK